MKLTGAKEKKESRNQIYEEGGACEGKNRLDVFRTRLWAGKAPREKRKER